MKHLEGSASSSLWFVSKRVLVIKQSQGLCHRFHHHWPSSERPSHRVHLYPPMLSVLETKTGGRGNTTVKTVSVTPPAQAGEQVERLLSLLVPQHLSRRRDAGPAAASSCPRRPADPGLPATRPRPTPTRKRPLSACSCRCRLPKN